jgi:phenylalanyl-tRNA synthetase beta chain
MKVGRKWLEQYADIPVPSEEYASRMVMRGTAVEGVENLREQVRKVVVGRVISIARHEQSDHLSVCQVDVSAGEPIQIVTGATNLKTGDLVPVALDGAVLPGGKQIRTSKLRGVLSQGMLCSGPELGVPVELYPSVGEEGILVFQEDYLPGDDVRPILGIDEDRKSVV